MPAYEMSLNVSTGGDSTSLAISGTSAQSVVFDPPSTDFGHPVLVSPSVDCFARQGLNPTALATGVDVMLRGGQTYRVWVSAGNKLALVTSGAAGTCYFTPQG